MKRPETPEELEQDLREFAEDIGIDADDPIANKIIENAKNQYADKSSAPTIFHKAMMPQEFLDAMILAHPDVFNFEGPNIGTRMAAQAYMLGYLLASLFEHRHPGEGQEMAGQILLQMAEDIRTNPLVAELVKHSSMIRDLGNIPDDLSDLPEAHEGGTHG